MKFSVKVGLLSFLICGVWMSAIASRNPIALEIASLSTVLLCSLAIPLSFINTNKSRRAFWAGFCSVGLSYYIVTSFYMPVENTNAALAESVMLIPGMKQIPDSTVSRKSVTTVSTKMPNGNIGSAQQFYDENVTVSIFQSIKQAVPFLQMLVFSCGVA
ncbi:MAG: hypothetical protein AAGA30_03985 [Planctomycetota bacterium]